MPISVTVSPLYAFGTSFNVDGKPLAGGKLFAYEAGSSSTLATTYSKDSGTAVANPNPIVLTSDGRLGTSLWLDQALQYHLVLTKPDGTTVLEDQDYVVPAASQAYVEQEITALSGDFLPLTGGSITGSLAVSGGSALHTTSVTGALTVTGNVSGANFTGTTFTGGINANSARVINVATPTTSTDAANKAYVDGLVNTGTPPGSIMYWATATAPAGYLKCDGTSYLRADYPNLFSAIGTTFGSVDGTHFNVPDLRGQFIRGLDESRGVDPGRVLGSTQLDALQNIVGYLGVDDRITSSGCAAGAFTASATTTAAGRAAGAPNVDTTAEGGDGTNHYAQFSASDSVGARTSTETRPTNVALIGIIKT
jgi:microcystin-dependent protein